MKRFWLGSVALIPIVATGSAGAADLARPVYKAPPPIAAPFSWTGCYLGGHIGGGWGQKIDSDPATGEVLGTADVDGFLGGGQIGCNYQFATNWVIGVEGDASWADIKGSVIERSVSGFLDQGIPYSSLITFQARTDFLATATGRVGYAWDRWLVYAKGGAAWADDRYSIVNQGCLGGVCDSFTFDASETRSGWTVGAGLEWAFWDNWSAKLEYNYMDFGKSGVTFASSAGSFQDDIEQHIHAIKLGVNYHFNWGAPVVSKY